MPKELVKKSEVTEFLSQFTPKQIIFFQEYLRTGNGTDSAVKAYDCKDRHSASVIAAENLGKLRNPTKMFLEAQGINISFLSKIVVEAAGAEKFNEFSGEKVPDHAIRLKAVDKLSKWLDLEASETTPTVQINQQFNSVMKGLEDEYQL